MRNLFFFLAKNSPFLVWLFLAIMSIILLCSYNPYQRSVWMSSANLISGSLYGVTSRITKYFALRAINEDLMYCVGQLEEENLYLKQQLQHLKGEQIPYIETRQYSYAVAHVVNNSIIQSENYITLDKGSNHGIKADLGVADYNGVVGIVANVSDHYALVISMLNPKIRVSAKLKNTDFFGSVVWEDCDSRHILLKDLPRNVVFQPGDTVVTSGYSSSFPEGILVGTVVESRVNNNNNFVTLVLALFTDFGNLNDVHVITNNKQTERLNLENKGI